MKNKSSRNYRCQGNAGRSRARESVNAAFVGLSYKEGMKALDSRTTTGSMIDEVVSGLSGVECWRTNLVDRVLFDNQGRLRNPTAYEIGQCFSRFEERVRKRRPRIVVTLGALTSKHILNRLAGTSFAGWAGLLNYVPIETANTVFIAAHHPSHIAVYRRRERREYVAALREAITGALEGTFPLGEFA